jgi:formate-dependent phosphoribosylglycinamide formyltransferase (GAR transformylase)
MLLCFVFPKVFRTDKRSTKEKAREKFLLDMVNLNTQSMPESCSNRALIQSSLKQTTNTGLRRHVLLLSARLGHEVKERQGYEKTASFALHEKRKVVEDLHAREEAAAMEKRKLEHQVCVNQGINIRIRKRLLEEKRRNKVLACGYAKYYKLNRRGLVQMTDADKMSLRPSQDLFTKLYMEPDSDE